MKYVHKKLSIEFSIMITYKHLIYNIFFINIFKIMYIIISIGRNRENIFRSSG